MTLICKTCGKESEVELCDPYCMDCDPDLISIDKPINEEPLTCISCEAMKKTCEEQVAEKDIEIKALTLLCEGKELSKDELKAELAEVNMTLFGWKDRERELKAENKELEAGLDNEIKISVKLGKENEKLKKTCEEQVAVLKEMCSILSKQYAGFIINQEALYYDNKVHIWTKPRKGIREIHNDGTINFEERLTKCATLYLNDAERRAKKNLKENKK